MRAFGFSTGALARNDVSSALGVAKCHHTDAVEYSAIRIGELDAMASYLLKSGKGSFRYVAFHAPSRFAANDEVRVVEVLKRLVKVCAMSIVVHPDTIFDFSLWQSFGEKLCIENMDHRKTVGRTADELALIFAKLPKARLCFDIGHAHEIDRSMSLAYEIVRRFHDRIAHIHASEVTDDCEHQAFSPSSHFAFMKLVDLLPASTPVILETDVPESRAGAQLEEAKEIFHQKVTDKKSVPKRLRTASA